jgi:hypothetical protein
MELPHLKMELAHLEHDLGELLLVLLPELPEDHPAELGEENESVLTGQKAALRKSNEIRHCEGAIIDTGIKSAKTGDLHRPVTLL